MKMYVFCILLFLLLSGKMYSQDDDVYYYYEEEQEEFHNDAGGIFFKWGPWVPLGNLSNQLRASPSFGFKVVLPLPQSSHWNFAVGSDFVLPTGRKEIDFYASGADNEIYRAKADFIYQSIGVWMEHESALNETLRLDKYGGLGIAGIITDLETGYYDENDMLEYHTINSINVNLGLRLRFRNMGVHAEYNYSPYSATQKVNSSFGNSSFTVGFSVRILPNIFY